MSRKRKTTLRAQCWNARLLPSDEIVHNDEFTAKYSPRPIWYAASIRISTGRVCLGGHHKGRG